MVAMPKVGPLPELARVFLDVRGPERAMRVSWHHEADTVVLSLWQFDRCVSSFRLDAAQVPELVGALVEGLGAYATPGSAGATPE